MDKPWIPSVRIALNCNTISQNGVDTSVVVLFVLCFGVDFL